MLVLSEIQPKITILPKRIDDGLQDDVRILAIGLFTTDYNIPSANGIIFNLIILEFYCYSAPSGLIYLNN